jgi:hypothetical protein
MINKHDGVVVRMGGESRGVRQLTSIALHPDSVLERWVPCPENKYLALS